MKHDPNDTRIWYKVYCAVVTPKDGSISGALAHFYMPDDQALDYGEMKRLLCEFGWGDALISGVSEPIDILLDPLKPGAKVPIVSTRVGRIPDEDKFVVLPLPMI